MSMTPDQADDLVGDAFYAAEQIRDGTFGITSSDSHAPNRNSFVQSLALRDDLDCVNDLFDTPFTPSPDEIVVAELADLHLLLSTFYEHLGVSNEEIVRR